MKTKIVCDGYEHASETATDNDQSNALCAECHVKNCCQLIQSPLMALPLPIFLNDVEGRYIGCNPAFCELMGVTPQQIEGKTVFDLWPLEQAEIYHQHDLALFENPQHRIYESVMRDKYGRTFPALFNKGVLYDKNGGIAGLIGIVTDISEMKQTEQALLESEERFRTLSEAIPQMVLVVDAKGQPVYYNRRLVQYTCQKASTNKDPARIIHPADLPYVRQKWERALSTGGFFQSELRLRRFDGMYRWFLARSIILRNDQGDVQGWYGTATDIDDLKQAEFNLQQLTSQKDEALALLNALIESAPIGIGFWNKDLKCIKLNQALADIKGMPVEEQLGLSPHEILPDMTQNGKALSDVQRVIEAGQPILDMEISRELPSSPGHKKSWAGTWFPVPLKDQVIGIGATLMDITDQKESQKALEYNSKRFELLSHSADALMRAPNPLQAIDFLCRLVMKFLDCQVFFHYVADEAAGCLKLNAYAGIPADEARRIETLEYGNTVCGCVARDGIPIVAENIQNLSDTRTERVQSHGVAAYCCHPLLGADAKVIGTLAFGSKNREVFSKDDVSMMKAIADQVAIAIVRMYHEQALRASEIALKQANMELEQLVNRRTAELAVRNREIRELAHQTLAAMENDRRALSKELHDSIAGTLSAIMYQIEGRVEEMGGIPPKGYMPFEKILDYLRDAIKETRYISKQLRPSVLDDFGLIPAIKDSVNDFNQFYPDIQVIQHIAISEDAIPNDIKTVLYRIVQESLNNVGKHSRAAKVEIKLQGRKEFAHLQVIDNGRGFNVNDILQHRELLGGYGLFSMKERVSICKGTVRIDSEPGKGTRIHISIPLLKHDQIDLF